MWVVVAAVAAAACAALLLLYGWFEAGLLRERVLGGRRPHLHPALDGVRIGHLSDFHFGAWASRGNGASLRACAWVARRRPDLVCITGDLMSHPRGVELLRQALGGLGGSFAVLGNHDVAITRDPFSRGEGFAMPANVVLLADSASVIELRGLRVQVAGVDARSYPRGQADPAALADPSAALRLLLCHYPSVVGRLPLGSFQLVLSGHLHGGQIVLPLPRKRLTLAHPRSRYVSGLYETSAGPIHVSPGTGTTFIPFRFFARPEVTELVLRSSAYDPFMETVSIGAPGDCGQDG